MCYRPPRTGDISGDLSKCSPKSVVRITSELPATRPTASPTLTTTCATSRQPPEGTGAHRDNLGNWFQLWIRRKLSSMPEGTQRYSRTKMVLPLRVWLDEGAGETLSRTDHHAATRTAQSLFPCHLEQTSCGQRKSGWNRSARLWEKHLGRESSAISHRRKFDRTRRFVGDSGRCTACLGF